MKFRTMKACLAMLLAGALIVLILPTAAFADFTQETAEAATIEEPAETAPAGPEETAEEEPADEPEEVPAKDPEDGPPEGPGAEEAEAEADEGPMDGPEAEAKPAEADEPLQPTTPEQIREEYGSQVVEQKETTIGKTNHKEIRLTVCLLKNGNKVLVTRYFIDGVLVKEEVTSFYPPETGEEKGPQENGETQQPDPAEGPDSETPTEEPSDEPAPDPTEEPEEEDPGEDPDEPDEDTEENPDEEDPDEDPDEPEEEDPGEGPDEPDEDTDENPAEEDPSEDPDEPDEDTEETPDEEDPDEGPDEPDEDEDPEENPDDEDPDEDPDEPDEDEDPDEDPAEDENQVVHTETQVKVEGGALVTTTTVVLRNGTTVTSVLIKDLVSGKTITAYTITVFPDGTVQRAEEAPLPAAEEEPEEPEEPEEDPYYAVSHREFMDYAESRFEYLRMLQAAAPRNVGVQMPNETLSPREMEEIYYRARTQGTDFMKGSNQYSFTRGNSLSPEEAMDRFMQSMEEWICMLEYINYGSVCGESGGATGSW